MAGEILSDEIARKTLLNSFRTLSTDSATLVIPQIDGEGASPKVIVWAGNRRVVVHFGEIKGYEVAGNRRGFNAEIAGNLAILLRQVHPNMGITAWYGESTGEPIPTDTSSHILPPVFRIIETV